MFQQYLTTMILKDKYLLLSRTVTLTMDMLEPFEQNVAGLDCIKIGQTSRCF